MHLPLISYKSVSLARNFWGQCAIFDLFRLESATGKADDQGSGNVYSLESWDTHLSRCIFHKCTHTC